MTRLTAEDREWIRAELQNGVSIDAIPTPEERHAEGIAFYAGRDKRYRGRKDRLHLALPVDALNAQTCRCGDEGWEDRDEDGDRFCAKCGKPR